MRKDPRGNCTDILKFVMKNKVILQYILREIFNLNKNSRVLIELGDNILFFT